MCQSKVLNPDPAAEMGVEKDWGFRSLGVQLAYITGVTAVVLKLYQVSFSVA